MWWTYLDIFSFFTGGGGAVDHSQSWELHDSSPSGRVYGTTYSLPLNKRIAEVLKALSCFGDGQAAGRSRKHKPSRRNAFFWNIKFCQTFVSSISKRNFFDSISSYSWDIFFYHESEDKHIPRQIPEQLSGARVPTILPRAFQYYIGIRHQSR